MAFGKNKLALAVQKPARRFGGGWDLADRLGPHFFFEDRVRNFAISGQGNKEHLITHVLGMTAGRMPVIVLHNNNHGMMAEIARVWTQEFGSLEYDQDGPLWSGSTGGFEPFLGLEEMDIVGILKDLGEVAGYSCTASFEKVVRAHLSILKYMDCPYSLSGLKYLCDFEDLEEFQSNIMLLPCSPMEKNRIIVGLGLSNEKDREQFEQFRSMIQRMAYEAKRSGWDPDTGVGTMSITTAIARRALMTVSVSAGKSPFFMAYLARELRLYSDEPCLLLIDEVLLESSGLVSVLRESGFDFRFGILGSNLLEIIGGERTEAQKFCEKLDLLVLLRHNVATTADALSELLGNMEVSKESSTSGTARDFFGWLPESKQKSVTMTVQEQRRVKPEQIMDLADEQAIVFHPAANEILLL